MGKKCLVALDGSKHSNNALVWTLENLIQLNDNNNDEDTLMLLSVGVLYNDNEISSFEYSAVTRNLLNVENDTKIEKAKVEKLAKEITKNGEKMVLDYYDSRNILEDKESSNLPIISNPPKIQLFFNSSSDPANSVIDFSRQNKVDVLIIGHRGLSRPDSSNLGSVAQCCLHSANCTVIVTRLKS
ncbi:3847_t:CDS:2 [Entrophospora sp. SA101]|nr:3847_t:CDS:2 [Entrophospora sp. SA101]